MKEKYENIEQEYLPGNCRDRIREQLIEKNMTQEELARKLQINTSTLGRYLNGTTDKLDLEKAMLAADIFEVSFPFLCGLTNDPGRYEFRIDELGLSVESARRLYSGEVDAEILNLLLENRYFDALTFQIRNYLNGILAAAAKIRMQLFDFLGSLLKEHGADSQADKTAVLKAMADIDALNAPIAVVEKETLQSAFDSLLSDLARIEKDFIDSAPYDKATADTLKYFEKELKKGKGRFDPHAVTPEQLGDIIKKYIDSSKFVDADQKEDFSKLAEKMFYLLIGARQADE